MNKLNKQTPPPQVTPTSDQLHSSFENSHHSKLIPIIIGAIILILVGVGSYILVTKNSQPVVEKVVSQPSPTPVDETANWRTYTNNVYGYSFSYPEQNLQLRESSDQLLEGSPNEGNYSYVYGCLPTCGAYSPGFGVYAFENLNKWDINAWLSSSSKSPLKMSGNEVGDALTKCINKDPRTKRINGTFLGNNSITIEFTIDQETVRMKTEGICSKDLILEGGGYQKWIIVENNGKIITIQITFLDDKDKAQLEQILSTFKFTK